MDLWEQREGVMLICTAVILGVELGWEWGGGQGWRAGRIRVVCVCVVVVVVVVCVCVCVWEGLIEVLEERGEGDEGPRVTGERD